jgi:hypothetical protein
MDHQNQQDREDEWQSRLGSVVYQFGLALKELQESNPWPDLPVLPHAMNDLMTELWDHGFSQTQIRKAFADAVADMPRYAAGKEVRS